MTIQQKFNAVYEISVALARLVAIPIALVVVPIRSAVRVGKKLFR